MNANQLLNEALALPGAYANTPFYRPEPICARIGKRVFAEVYPSRNWVTLRSEPQDVLCWRQQYPAVGRGYYCPPNHQPYAFTVTLDGSVPEVVLRLMLRCSYEHSLRTLPKAEREKAVSARWK